MPEDWRDDYAKKIVNAKMRRFAEIGAFLSFSNAVITKISTKNTITYRIDIVLENKTPRYILVDHSEIGPFFKYTIDEKAKTRFMAFILGQHD